MSTWIELRCEDRGGDNEDCLSDDNCGPMGMANDSRESVLQTLRVIEAEGRADGWVKTRDGWVCPECKKLREGKEPA